MKTSKTKKNQRDRRRKRIRAKVSGTALRPRFSVFKSNRYLTAQLINDEKGVTLLSVTTKDRKEKTALERSFAAGADVGKRAKEKNIDKVVFDRGGYIYTGSVAAIAEGARKEGLKF